MAKKKTFSKLRNHLTSTELDEKAAMLENITRMPTNNTAFVFQGDPSNPQGNSFETITDGETDETDYNIGENPTSSTEARDTTGLFNSGGDHSKGEFVKTVEPPGDTSYVLGPMAAMYYTWSYPWTMVGYIRESDRKMVNLGRIDGKLSDWDGSSGNGSSGSGTFYSYGQLTTEQALWFRDIKKAFGNTNDPTTYSYRAFYPGPPSATPDAFGRYPCILTGVSKKEPNTHPDSTPLDKQAGDNFSAQQEKNKRGSGIQGEISPEDLNKINQAINAGMIALDVIAVLGILFPEPGTSIAGAARLATRLAAMKGIKQSVRNRLLRGALNPLGQRAVRSGAAGRVRRQVYSGRGYQGTRGFGKTTYGTTNQATGRTYTNPGALKGLRGTGGKTNPKGTLDTGTLPQRYIDKYGSRSVQGQQQIKLGKKAAQRTFGNSYDMDGNLLFESNDQIESRIDKMIEILQKPEHKDKLNGFAKKLLDYIENQNQEGEQKVEDQKESISLERKREIFGHLTQPVVLPETKQKTYNVSPGQRYKNKNKKPKETNFQDMDKLFNKNIGGPQPFKPQERTSWTKDFINQNVIQSQEKMNGVLELVGNGKHAFGHAMNDYKKMGTKELEQYWGKNPNMYSFLFNGKKYNVTRKEHIDGDSVVFMEDQQGVKSNMLQSKINEILQEENEKWINEAYFKSHPVIPEKEESTYELIKRRFLENKKIAPEFPAEPPPKMVNGYHPKFGKHAARYKKLDPASANAMPETGDPETDELVRKQKTINKIKKMGKNK